MVEGPAFRQGYGGAGFGGSLVTTTATLARYQMFIGGQWVDASSGDHFESDDPFLGEPWALIPRGTAEDVDRAVRAAHRAFTSGEWPTLTASRRGALLRRLGDLITERVEGAGRDRGPRQRQALRRDEHADGVHGAVVSLLRRPGRQDRRRGPPDRQARHVQLHALRAARRRRRDRAVELAAAADWRGSWRPRSPPATPSSSSRRSSPRRRRSSS